MMMKKLAVVLLGPALIGLPVAGAEEKRQEPEKKKQAEESKPDEKKVWTNEDLERLFGGAEESAGDEQPAPAPAKPEAAPSKEKEKPADDAGAEQRRLAEARKKVDAARERVKQLEEKVEKERAAAMGGLRSRRVVAPSQGELDQAKKELQEALAALEKLRAPPE